jgi:hypothetical protein
VSTSAIFWPGSGSVPVTSSLGIYMSDVEFQAEAPKVAAWCCGRLGYPVMDIELVDTQLYDCFEEAITEYSSQINEFNMRENMLALQGQSTGSNLSGKLITTNPVSMVVELSTAYGTEAGVGGTVDWKMGYIDTVAGTQEYDLQLLWGAVSESNTRIEIRRVFHERTPAITRGGFGFGDSATGPNDGTNNLLGEFGWAGYDGGLNAAGGAAYNGSFLVMPLYDTLLRTQAIELNDQIRRSQYSFEIHNNKVRFMPVPSGERIFFQYTLKGSSLSGSAIQIGNYDVITDFSNAPYYDIKYSNINDVGKRWIRKMTLALVKDTLGRILSKYENIPTPNDKIMLDGKLLRQEAEKEKETLWDQLRESLAQAGRSSQMEKMAASEQHAQEILSKVPNIIYIG